MVDNPSPARLRQCSGGRPLPMGEVKRACSTAHPWSPTMGWPRVRSMQRSSERFLTTHTGSLPRPDDLIRMMYAKEEGVPVDAAALAARIKSAVAEVVKKQADAGIDLINDGEMSKPSYATYIKDRLSGFGGTGNTFVYQDLAEFPKLAQRVFGDPGLPRRRVAVLPQRPLQRPRDLSARHRGGDARRIRDRRQGRYHPADRLPRSRHGSPYPVRQSRSARVPQACRHARRGA